MSALIEDCLKDVRLKGGRAESIDVCGEWSERPFSSVSAGPDVLACRIGRYSSAFNQCGLVTPDEVLDTSSSEHSARLSIPTMAKQSDPSNVVRVAIPALKTLSSGKLFGSAASADCMNQRQPSALTIAIHQPRWLGS